MSLLFLFDLVCREYSPARQNERFVKLDKAVGALSGYIMAPILTIANAAMLATTTLKVVPLNDEVRSYT